jgi:predicted RNA-binding Zn ribbon-like protein
MSQMDRAINQRKPWQERTLFISGRLCLDFAHTGGPGPYKKFERLHTPADLSLWLSMSELTLKNTSTTQADLKRAHKLRWAIWQAANALRVGDVPAAPDIEIINKTAALPTLVPVLNHAGAQHAWQQPVTAQAALATIARDAIELFSHHTELPIQQCANPNCPLLFVDNSRAGKRKWCAMERCGNLMKVAKYRESKVRT